LRLSSPVCYSLAPLRRAREKPNQIKRLTQEARAKSCGKAKKEFDEHHETLHNLISLLLTNKTIRSAKQAVPNKVL
jgi:acyl-CoA reductase-like NAD-dependent aldehyde dehydrogenase